MNKFDVTIRLEKLAAARTEWSTKRREFDDAYETALLRLVYEGLRAFMTIDEMATSLSVPTTRVRTFMRRNGVEPRQGKRVLSDQAAVALRDNAELLGIDPINMDLTSPLAYLPMGEKMKRELQDEQVSSVNEFPETECRCPDCGREVSCSRCGYNQ